ncbi:MAG: leucyl aminopeptidase, partial [Carbonactinosporaceae bacterium]
MTTIDLTSQSPASLKVDTLVVGVCKGPKGLELAPGAADIDKAFKRKLPETLVALGATAKADEVTKVATLGATKAGLVVAVGLGDARNEYDPEVLRRAAGAATRGLAGTAKVGLALPADDPSRAGAVAEGALLGAYAFLRYRSDGVRRTPVEELALASAKARDKTVRDAVTRAEAVAAAVHLCRDLVNTPPSDLHPEEFAEAAAAACREAGLEVEVLDDDALQAGGYGGIIGVGQGSVHPPRLVRVHYRHPKAKRRLALVGKGITFDSGGLSLKPAQSMEWMKSDMGGAGAVLAAMTVIARLKPQVEVTAWLPMAENMPSGTAQRPSDVLTIYGGRTVEVNNTDAEGRLILADALARACEDDPDLVVDAATLTGAQLVALGTRTCGIMANDDALLDKVHASSRRCGEQMWPMPLPRELRKTLDSEVADISNVGERNGAMLIAGVFLREFVPDTTRWAHLDIAGPSWNSGDPHGYTPKGGTGVAVRTLVQIAED